MRSVFLGVLAVVISALVLGYFIKNQSHGAATAQSGESGHSAQSGELSLVSLQEEGSSDRQETETDPFQPVDNMHHFMEYISEPAYKGLRESLKDEPANRRAWKPIKNHALVLAETAGVLAKRYPEDADEEQIKEWHQLSVEVYEKAKALYGSTGNYEKAVENFGAMIDSCNQCHTSFADGKYQLEK